MPDRRAVVGVMPAAERALRTRLFDAFEDAYPVRFEGRDTGAERGLDAAVRFASAGDDQAPSSELPELRYLAEECEPRGDGHVAFATHPGLARALWNATLTEARAEGAPTVTLAEGDVALARIEGAPVWSLTAGPVARHRVSVAPAELARGDALRSRLAPGRCLGVLALTQFVRNLTADRDWRTPGTRAAFVIDDPNLRRPTYGHIDYPELAASATALGYHVSIAMVPLDGRAVHQATAQLFRRQSAQLSLCIHGNNHLRDELQSPRSLAEARVPAAQAMVRSLAFERRTGLTVDRVMVAPHERLGEPTAAAMFACGFEGFSGTRPYPWLEYAHDLSWLSRPVDSGPLVGWRSAELVGQGLLALLRVDFSHPREELVIRAFLDQPLIMYGHDDLLRGGPDELEGAVREIGQLGDVRWESLGNIARGSLATRRCGSALQVRMLARRVRFEIPSDVREVVVYADGITPFADERLTVTGAARRAPGEQPPGVTRLIVDRPGTVEVALDHPLDLLGVPMPRANVHSVVRRLMSEGRDRTRSKLAWSPR